MGPTSEPSTCIRPCGCHRKPNVESRCDVHNIQRSRAQRNPLDTLTEFGLLLHKKRTFLKLVIRTNVALEFTRRWGRDFVHSANSQQKNSLMGCPRFLRRTPICVRDPFIQSVNMFGRALCNNRFRNLFSMRNTFPITS